MKNNNKQSFPTAALPSFLRGHEFFGGLFDLADIAPERLARTEALRSASATHSLQLFGVEDYAQSSPEDPRIRTILDIGLGLLTRGHWTMPSWRLERYFAALASEVLGWQVQQLDEAKGNLGFQVAPKPEHAAELIFAHVSGRFASEAIDTDAAAIWDNVALDERGSDAEKRFLDGVLIPELGFPLLDFLAPQRRLSTMVRIAPEFADQRVDFALDTYRQLRLAIEIDGDQHLTVETQRRHDKKRDAALIEAGWNVWRISASELGNLPALREHLATLLRPTQRRRNNVLSAAPSEPRGHQLMSLVWGATVAARVQSALLFALQRGLLPWDGAWRIAVIEHETRIASAALADFHDWFGRLRQLYGFAPLPPIQVVAAPAVLSPTSISDWPEVLAFDGQPDLTIDVSVIRRHDRSPIDSDSPTYFSRPTNEPGWLDLPAFQNRLTAATPISEPFVTDWLRDILRKPSLRDGQFAIIERILVGKDTIGLLPTGGGKSLTYQLASVLLPGMTLYVSPLKSLMQDQRERLYALGFTAVGELSSNQSRTENQTISELLALGQLRFLIVTPERMLVPSFRKALVGYRATAGEVAQVVIDECHCLSEWGHDFRPAYLSLSRIARDKTNRLQTSAPLVALTGTASSVVLADIKRELGIQDSEAIVRAKNLERPELSLEFQATTAQDRVTAAAGAVSTFVAKRNPNDGILVFCRFVGRDDGVVAVYAKCLQHVPREDIRFFAGTGPKTATLQQYLGRQPNAIPEWLNVQRSWDKTKADTQREFISGKRNSFPVLIATQAFGMGIDKPTIRMVVHTMAPPSPEAYYQEVGRAGRDRQPARAILMFSNENAEAADYILAPERTLEEVRKYRDGLRRAERGGGDFLETFYFHDQAFVGVDLEVEAFISAINGVREARRRGRQPLVEFGDGDGKRNEYALVRMLVLDVISDYEKSYVEKLFSIHLDSRWATCADELPELREYYLTALRNYTSRYLFQSVIPREASIQAAATVSELEAIVARSLVEFIYEQIERKRRFASRQMLEFARIGCRDAAKFRQALLNYLQVSARFTFALEAIPTSPYPGNWMEILESAASPDELRELHGACQRILESYSNEPRLLAISALSRPSDLPEADSRSEEDVRAALRFSKERFGIQSALQLGKTMRKWAASHSVSRHALITLSFGRWLVRDGRLRLALEEAGAHAVIRRGVLFKQLRSLNDDIEAPWEAGHGRAAREDRAAV